MPSRHLGVVYLLVGVLGFVVPMLFGLLPHGYSIVDNLIHWRWVSVASWSASSYRSEAPRRGRKKAFTRRAGAATTLRPSFYALIAS